MSSVGDSSQISDLSGISHISRSSGLRQTKVDSAFSIFDCQASSTFREPPKRSTVSGQTFPAGATKLGVALKLIARCDDAVINGARLKLLHDCLSRVAQREADSAVTNNCATRLRSILAAHEAKKYLQLPNGDKKNIHELSLLGIIDLPQCRLNHEEKRDLNAQIETMFGARLNSFIESYEKSGGNITELLKSHESSGKTSLQDNHETDLIRWNDSTNEISTEYYRDLVSLADIFCQWKRLKYIEMREVNGKNAENLLLQSQIAEIQANISRKTCESRMFNETPYTVNAFGMLSEILDTRNLEIRQEIQRKERLRMNYADVTCTDYEQLLKKYTELCEVIRKKERLMEML